MPKRTLQRNVRRRKKKHGFRSRTAALLRSRRNKGRKRLSA